MKMHRRHGTSAQIANTFAGKDVDLMCGIATPMAQAEYSVAMKSDIPVIFTAVTYPLQLNWQTQTEPLVGGSQVQAISFL